MASKWNNDVAKEVKAWIARASGCAFPGGNSANDFFEALNSGVVLCILANKLKPGVVKKFHQNAKMPFHKMENIGHFTDFVSAYGIPAEYKFVTNDLYTQANMNQVLMCLDNVKKEASKKGYR